MNKGNIKNKIITKYNLKHGDFIDINGLKFLSAKEKIEIDDLIIILRISVGNKNRLLRSPLNKARINIFTTYELKETEISLKDELQAKEKITKKCQERLCNKYKISKDILSKMILKNQSYELNEKHEYSILRYEKNENKINKELFVQEVKNKDSIDRELIECLKQKYILNDEEVRNLLNVKKSNYEKLMQIKTKTMKIDLLDEYEKEDIKEKLIERYREQDYITKEEIIKTKQEIGATNTIIKDVLSISGEGFCRVMNGKINRTRIMMKREKLKIDQLKMDIKYKYGEGPYTNTKLRNLCKKYEIEFDNFLKSLSTNVNRYAYIKQALKENKKGIYIGEDRPLSKEFLKKYDKRIENMCIRVTNKYCNSSYLYTEKLDISQGAYMLILQRGGNIERNFSYDEDLIFGLFASKVKYFAIGARNKRYKEILLDNIERYISKNDEYDIFGEDSSDFCKAKDNRIKQIHQNVLKIIEENKDYVYSNRKNAYKIISYNLKITIEKLTEIIKEIGEIYIEYGFAKKCLNGDIIDMSEVETIY